MKILINIFTHSLGEPLCLAVELDRAPLGHGHVAAALLVVNAGRDDHLQVRHLALHGGRVHLGVTILVAMSLWISVLQFYFCKLAFKTFVSSPAEI